MERSVQGEGVTADSEGTLYSEGSDTGGNLVRYSKKSAEISTPKPEIRNQKSNNTGRNQEKSACRNQKSKKSRQRGTCVYT